MEERDSGIEFYADSLVALGRATDSLLRLEDELSRTLEFLTGNVDIKSFLADPVVGNEGKAKAVRELLEERIDVSLLHFILILQEQRQLVSLPVIARAFSRKVSQLLTKTSGNLFTALPLTDEKVADIEKQVSLAMGKDVRFHVHVDPSMLGGIRLQIGELILDGTVSHQLETMHRRLLQ